MWYNKFKAYLFNGLNICKSCEYFNESLHQCRHCGCFLQIKTSWASEKCPIDKWNSEIEVKNQELTQVFEITNIWNRECPVCKYKGVIRIYQQGEEFGETDTGIHCPICGIEFLSSVWDNLSNTETREYKYYDDNGNLVRRETQK